MSDSRQSGRPQNAASVAREALERIARAAIETPIMYAHPNDDDTVTVTRESLHAVFAASNTCGRALEEAEGRIEELESVVRACLESLEYIERDILPEGQRFAGWTHPANSMRWARDTLAHSLKSEAELSQEGEG